MNNTGVLAVSENMKGDITSCKIENQLVGIERASIFSLKEVETRIAYDVCSKQVVREYSVPTVTVFGAVMMLPIVFIAFIIPFAIYVTFSEKNDKRKGTYGRGF